MVSIPIANAEANESPMNSPLPSPSGSRKKEAILYACIFCVPEAGDNHRDVEPFESMAFEDGADFESIQISHPIVPNQLDPTIRSPKLRAKDQPVCVYYRNLDSRELVEIRLRPCRRNDPLQPLRSPVFESLRTFWRTSFQLESQPEKVINANVVPGHSLPLIWTFYQSDRTDAPSLVNFHSHIHDEKNKGEKEWDLSDDEMEPMDEDTDADTEHSTTPIIIKQKQPREMNGASVHIPIELRKRFKLGVKALAWDDWTGRIFVATPTDCMIHVLDLGQGPSEGKYVDSFLLCLVLIQLQIQEGSECPWHSQMIA